MASLCISPVHAGIMLLSSANSSFILLRRRRSIRLWAVLRAIFLPAALVALGCFFLVEEEEEEEGSPLPLAEEEAAPVPAPGPASAAVLAAAALPVARPDSLVVDAAEWAPAAVLCWVRGFIWIIFLDRVGGGGRAKVLLLPAVVALPEDALEEEEEEEVVVVVVVVTADERLRDLTVSAACMGYRVLGEVAVSRPTRPVFALVVLERGGWG
jgi:hypothetical protein